MRLLSRVAAQLARIACGPQNPYPGISRACLASLSTAPPPGLPVGSPVASWASAIARQLLSIDGTPADVPCTIVCSPDCGRRRRAGTWIFPSAATASEEE